MARKTIARDCETARALIHQGKVYACIPMEYRGMQPPDAGGMPRAKPNDLAL